MMHRTSPKDAPVTTKHRRITISLPPEVDAALLALAEAEDRPQSKIVTEILTGFAPQMLSMAKLHGQIKAGKTAEAKRTMQHMVGDQMAALLADQGDMFKGKKK
jgi:predicted transcriptional regulator